MIFFHVSFVCFSSFTAAPCAPRVVCAVLGAIGFKVVQIPLSKILHEDELVDNNKKRKRVLAGRLCAVSLKRRNKFSHFRQKRAATGLRLVKEGVKHGKAGGATGAQGPRRYGAQQHTGRVCVGQRTSRTSCVPWRRA